MVFHLPVHEEVFGDMNERLRRKAGVSSPPTGEERWEKRYANCERSSQ